MKTLISILLLLAVAGCRLPGIDQHEHPATHKVHDNSQDWEKRDK